MDWKLPSLAEAIPELFRERGSTEEQQQQQQMQPRTVLFWADPRFSPAGTHEATAEGEHMQEGALDLALSERASLASSSAEASSRSSSISGPSTHAHTQTHTQSQSGRHRLSVQLPTPPQLLGRCDLPSPRTLLPPQSDYFTRPLSGDSLGTRILSPYHTGTSLLTGVSPIDQPCSFSAGSPALAQMQQSQALPAISATAEPRGKRRRGNLPKNVTSLLRGWLSEHTTHPYPTEEEKVMLAAQTGLNLNQISNWFINARRRILAPAEASRAASLSWTDSMPSASAGHTPPEEPSETHPHSA